MILLRVYCKGKSGICHGEIYGMPNITLDCGSPTIIPEEAEVNLMDQMIIPHEKMVGHPTCNKFKVYLQSSICCDSDSVSYGNQSEVQCYGKFYANRIKVSSNIGQNYRSDYKFSVWVIVCFVEIKD